MALRYVGEPLPVRATRRLALAPTDIPDHGLARPRAGLGELGLGHGIERPAELALVGEFGNLLHLATASAAVIRGVVGILERELVLGEADADAPAPG